MMLRVLRIVKQKYPGLITEWQHTYDREFAENEERVRNRVYPQGQPYNPVDKEGIPDTDECKQLVREIEELGIKT